MKKILLSLLLVLGIAFTGCGDFSYIDTVKNKINGEKEFDEETGEIKPEFYRNGRIKFFSEAGGDYSFENKPISFEELTKQLETLDKELDSAIVEVDNAITEDDRANMKVNYGEYFSIEVNCMDLIFRAHSLSKNLTSEEKEKLSNLIKASNALHKKAQKFWID